MKHNKKLIVAMLIFVALFAFYHICYASILKSECPPVDVPFSASIKFSQNKFLCPTVVDVDICINAIKDIKNALKIYMPNGDVFLENYVDADLYIAKGKSKTYSFSYNVGNNELSAKELNFVIKYPVVLNKKQTVYRNYTLSVQIEKISKNDIPSLKLDFICNSLMEQAGSPINFTYKISNNGMLVAKDIVLDLDCEIFSGKLNLGELKPNETIEKQINGIMLSNTLISNAKLSFFCGGMKIENVLESNSINLGLPYLKLIIK